MENASILGLNNYEIRAYETLIRLGKSTAPKISRISGVPNGKIYFILDLLAKKGLIDIIPKEPREFIPNNPALLLNLLDKRNNELTNVKNDIEQLKELYKREKEAGESKILVRQGKKAFYNIVNLLPEPKKYVYSIKWNYEFHKDWAKSVKNRLRNGKDIKIMARYDDDIKRNFNRWSKIHKNVKIIDNEGVAMSIQDDDKVLITIIGCNSTILIKDPAFAKLMKKMYLETFNSARHVGN